MQVKSTNFINVHYGDTVIYTKTFIYYAFTVTKHKGGSEKTIKFTMSTTTYVLQSCNNILKRKNEQYLYIKTVGIFTKYNYNETLQEHRIQ